MGRWMGTGCGGSSRGFWLTVVAMLLMTTAAAAENIEYSEIDRATVRVLTLDAVDTYEVEMAGRRFVLASPLGGHGSGFVVTSDGLVVTAAHVVSGARVVAVHVPGVTGPVPARVVHIDQAHDVAFLSARHHFSSLATLVAPGAKLEIRSELYAVGYPLDVTRSDPQSARGVLSGRLPDGRLQLNIDLNPGNSGGPVIDAEGRVLGVVSGRSDVASGAVGLAAAVPVDAFREDLDEALQMPPTQPYGVADERLAELLSLVAHEGETVVRGSVNHDGPTARLTESRVRDLLAQLPESADAVLLGAVFFWNRHVALLAHGGDPAAPLDRALKLVRRAVELDPELTLRSEFVRYVQANVASAETKGALEAARAAARSPRAALVRFESDADELTLHVKRTEPPGAPFGRVCTAPCAQPLVRGSYRAALSKHPGELVDVDGRVDVDGPTTVSGRYEDRSALRTAGWVVALGGPVAGVALAAHQTERCGSDEASTTEVCADEHPYLGYGLLLAATSLAVGVVLATRRDEATLTIGPGVTRQSGRPRLVGREAGALSGISLWGTF